MTKNTKTVLGILMAAIVGLAFVPPNALADQSPPGCNANLLSLAISKDQTVLIAGQTGTFNVNLTNPGPGGPGDVGCDTTDVSVTFTCPGPTGQPNGPSTILITGASYPAQPPSGQSWLTLPCVMPNANPVFVRATASGNLQDIEGGQSPFTISKDLQINIQPCAVKVDKQVSCDGGTTWVDQGLVDANEDGTGSCIGVDGEKVAVRYQVRNASGPQVTLYNCVATESNAGIGPGPGAIGNILPGATTDFYLDDNQVCSDQLEAGEPDTVAVTCYCTADLNEDLKASATDIADFECQNVGLEVTKVCDPQDGDINGITITVKNTGDSDLTDCMVTDEIYLEDHECPADMGSGTSVVVSPDQFDLAASATTLVTGTVTGLTADACNKVSVTCYSALIDDTITVQADDLCEAGQGCLTRTPGFWGTHPAITAMFLPLRSCGLDVNTTAAKTLVSATEDMCSVGTDAKTVGTSPQQIQLIRQCMAANLNIAATTAGGGSCESQYAGINEIIDECCNAVDSVCNSGASPAQISMSGCISKLDAFNNLPDTLDPFGPFFRPGPADPTACKASKNNGWVNPGRNLGPQK